MKENWILTLICAAVGIGVVVAIVVLGAYGHYLGPISRQANDWGSFGSVMSGAFTLLSSFATIGTLLFLYLQQVKSEKRQTVQDSENITRQQKHDDVVEKQLAALTFEQYLNHRKVFIERLNEQAFFFKGAIVFSDPDRVYTAMFPKNNPSHCEYKVSIDRPENKKAYDLADCLAIYASISELLENYRDMEKHLSLIENIVRLQDCLGITYTEKIRDGDITFLNLHAGINIYEIPKILQIIEHVLNSILFYTGNENITPIHHKGQSPLLRDGLYKTLTTYRRAKGSIEIKFETEALPHLHYIWDEIQSTFINERKLFPETIAALSTLLSGHQEIRKLQFTEHAAELTRIIGYDIFVAKQEHAKAPQTLKILDSMERSNNEIRELLAVTIW